jgi:hypothetical protein
VLVCAGLFTLPERVRPPKHVAVLAAAEAAEAAEAGEAGEAVAAVAAVAAGEYLIHHQL